MNRRTIGVILLVWCAVVLAGCASTIPPVSLVYSPSVGTGGGSGEVFLKTTSSNVVSNVSNIRWVLGKRKDSDGKVTGDVLSAFSAEDMVGDALRQELMAAGYKVECGPTMPSAVRKGIELADVQIGVDEEDGIPKVDANGTVKISIDIWKDGHILKRISYESNASDFAVINRDNLPREIVEQGLREVMRRAVPEIVTVLK